MERTQILIALAASASILAGPAVAQDYTPAEEYYDLSDQPDTGMFVQGGPERSQGGGGKPPVGKIQNQEIVVGPATFTVNYPIFDSFDDLPDDVDYVRGPIQSFERPEGETHYYEVVRVDSMNVSWVQAALLAQAEGGYLASMTSPEENAFVFSLVDDDKYFWEFPDDYTSNSHYRIKIGPFLGGVRVSDTEDSLAGWRWLSGEEWTYSNWAQNLNDGIIDRDPRNNTQPNGKGNQNVMGFGELNVPVQTWGDYWDTVAQYGERGMPSGYNRGFVIEYNELPQ